MEGRCGIYEIRNIVTNDAYVGSTADKNKRYGEHIRCLRGNYHVNPHLQNAWNKYTEQSFVFNWLEDVCEDVLLEREQEYLDSGIFVYNIAKCATASMKGRKHSEATRQKLSESHKNPSQDTRRKISEANTGRVLSDEVRRNMSESRTGHSTSKETRRKISAALIGHPVSEESRRKSSEKNTGRKHSEAAKRKIGEKSRGRKVSEETRRKIGEANSNPSEETRHRISESAKNRPVNNSSGYKGIYLDKSTGKWVVCYHKKHVGRYEAIEDAVKALQEFISSLNISTIRS